MQVKIKKMTTVTDIIESNTFVWIFCLLFILLSQESNGGLIHFIAVYIK